jgi:RNA polymerase sigma-70 factor (ECF subfamily)
MSTLVAPGMTSGSLEQELEKLFRQHYQMLYRTAYSILGNSADAEDVPQTIFLRLLRSGIKPDMQGNPEGYLYRAAVNLSLNVVRSRKRQAPAASIERVEIPCDDADSNLTQDTHQRLSKAIAELDPEIVQLLILRYVHNRSDAAIAKLLGVSRGMIAMRLFRARARLKQLMRTLGEKYEAP